MKKLALSMCLLPILGVTVMNAQVSKNGGISQEMLQQIVKTQPQSSADRALVNAIAGNKIDDLAKNYKNSATMTTFFSVETPKQSIHDQKSSGRCWCSRVSWCW